MNLISLQSDQIFQSTHPLRDATVSKQSNALMLLFQSTHPLRDATPLHLHSQFFFLISIHAPLTGCDNLSSCYICLSILFQSTHPLRDATFFHRHNYFLTLHFNPRTPYGMRLSNADNSTSSSYFNPRTPYGMRQLVSASLQWWLQISIHAPLTGCDHSFLSSSS